MGYRAVMTFRVVVMAFAVAALSAASAGAAAARAHRQAQPQAAPQAPEAPAITAGQLQRWFDAYAVVQAQDALQLTEAQYGPFVTRLKALQETRRRHQQARQQILGSIRKLVNPPKDGSQSATPDDRAVSEQLKALRDEDERAAADLQKAYDGVDEVLNVPQQARFRVFEDRMEQQKLELLLRARQNARARGRGR
ncbi:MAG TPA: hypothetical protein VGL62_07970 [Vicinamibacterales bacterium]|jgi:hypothetical protein